MDRSAIGRPGGPELHEIATEECLDLLAAAPVGRVAWTGPDGPQVVPVAIAMHEGAVVFRTAAYSALAHGVRDATVAVEIDEVDPVTRTGWSVLVTGPAEIVVDPADLVGLWQRGGPEPWAPGMRTLFVRVDPRTVTGRRVLAS